MEPRANRQCPVPTQIAPSASMDGEGVVSDATSCEILRLPAEVLSSVIGRSTPKDACCCAAVSTWFRLSADSDTAWSLLLPPDINSILSRADAPPAPALSKKLLFQSLCDRPILLDAGTVSFCLERASGKKVWMLPAREISIIWGSTPQYWQWHPHPDSRFPECAELMDVCWLEIGGTIISGMLSPNSTYAAYFVYKLSSDWYGLDYQLSRTSVSVGGVQVSGRENVCLASRSMPMVFEGRQLNFVVVDDEIDVGDEVREDEEEAEEEYEDNGYEESGKEDDAAAEKEVVSDNGNEDSKEDEEAGEELPVVIGGWYDSEEVTGDDEGGDSSSILHPRVRADGWMEVEMGEFHIDISDDSEIRMKLMGSGNHWKRGLIVEGIEIRPWKLN